MVYRLEKRMRETGSVEARVSQRRRESALSQTDLQIRYRWTGNIRELRNCMEYLHHMGLREVTLEDLPKQFLDRTCAERGSGDAIGRREWAVWQVLGELYSQNRGIGRQGLVRACGNLGVCLSEHEVREELRRLQDAGWLAVGQGRGGTRLTEAGYARYLELLDQ